MNEEFIEKELYKKRIKECLTCIKFNSDNYLCEECGCNVIIKAFIKKTTCPLNKWKEDDR